MSRFTPEDRDRQSNHYEADCYVEGAEDRRTIDQRRNSPAAVGQAEKPKGRDQRHANTKKPSLPGRKMKTHEADHHHHFEVDLRIEQAQSQGGD
jgi:hypothetical protein